MRAVIDTGIFVSALIRKQGTTGAVLRAPCETDALLLFIQPTL